MRQSLFTIAPDVPFLPTLAQAVADGTLLSGWRADGPFRLADVTIFLPTRRARLALAEAFLKLGDGLLPDIRALGGEDETAEPFLPSDGTAPPPPEMPLLERRMRWEAMMVKLRRRSIQQWFTGFVEALEKARAEREAAALRPVLRPPNLWPLRSVNA